MAVLTVRNVPDAVHRALRQQASLHGRSTEAEVREILQAAVAPPERVKPGAFLAAMSRKARLTNADVAALEKAMELVRDNATHEPIRFE